MARLVWRIKLVAELEPGVASETEVARIERDDFAVEETLGPTLEEGKRLMAAAQAGIGFCQPSRGVLLAVRAQPAYDLLAGGGPDECGASRVTQRRLRNGLGGPCRGTGGFAAAFVVSNSTNAAVKS